MAYVQVPRDLSKFESKIAFNLTKRQLICFSVGALLAIPTYMALKDTLPLDLCSFIAFFIMAPFFMLGIYKKDGIPFEKYMYIVLRQKYFRPQIRIYETKNIYKTIVREGGNIESSAKKTDA